jgi:hypothetical protein
MTHKSQTMNGNQSPPDNGQKHEYHETCGSIFLEHTECDESSKQYSSSISRKVACFRHSGLLWILLGRRGKRIGAYCI